ncbi:formyl transferase [Gorgonomyces haynaldii]|nr:formyl transferase [Gorgonomyces haynaldii]
MKIVVYVSGNGSNLQAIIDSIKNGVIKGEIALVVSNKANAYGLERAAQNNIPTMVKTLKSYKDQGKSRVEYDVDLAKEVLQKLGREPDLQVLAGFMHILSADFLNHFKNPIINLHPALPGAFDGAHAIERAFEAYTKGEIQYTGVMVHRVIPEVDRGAVVLQEQIPIQEQDTLESLETKIHAVEHQLLVKAIVKLIQ